MDKKRTTALLCAFILVFVSVFSGCAKKVTYKEKSTKADDSIVIGEEYGEDIPEDSEIVVGEDGQSYLVDGEGNSVVYEAPSAYVVPGQSVAPVVTPGTSTTLTTTTKKTAYKLTIRKDEGIKTITINGNKMTNESYSAKIGEKVTLEVTELKSGYEWNKWSETTIVNTLGSNSKKYTFTMPARDVMLVAITNDAPTTASQKDTVYSIVQSQRKSGGTDISGLTAYKVDVLRVPFSIGEEDDAAKKDFLVEFHKGAYGTSTIGCETGIYKKANDYSWIKIDNADETSVNMTLWQYQEAEAPKQILTASSANCWWLGKFENGTGNASSMVMKCSIGFKSKLMMEAFADALSAKGFEWGDTDSYKNTGRLSVSGTTVTLVW